MKKTIRPKHTPKKRHFSRIRKHWKWLLLVTLVILAGMAFWQYRAIHIQEAKNETVTSAPVTDSSVKYGISLGDSFIRQSPAQISTQLKQIKELGFTDVRFTVSWYIVQPTNASTFEWKLYDRLMTSVKQNGLHGLAIINYTPAWARSTICPKSAYCVPAQPQQFATFAAATAKRYAPSGLHNYEIWNEENIKSFWQPSPSAAGYAAVLKAAYPAIKAADTKSTVVLGGMSGVSIAGPGYLEPRDYLQALYKAGVKNYFDVLGYHAYTFPELPNDSDGGKNAWSKLASTNPSLRSIMANNGDGNKKIWITEVGAPTDGPGTVVSASVKRIASSDHVDNDLQSAIAKQVLDNSTKLPWLGAVYWYTYQDKGVHTDSPENFYGLKSYDGVSKPALNVFQDFLTRKDNG